MKKFLALVMAAAMLSCLALTGCGSSSASSDTAAETAAAETAAAETAAAEAGAAETTVTEEESDLAAIQEKGTMIVGITEYAPMDYQDDSGNWIGFDADLGHMVADKLGIDIEFIVIDWDNKQLELDSGAVDCIWNGMTLTDEVASSMGCTDTYVINAQVVVVKSDIADNYTSVDEMTDLTFAVEAGSAGESAASDRGLNYTSVEAQSDALLEVASGSSDACIIDLTMANAMTGEGTSYADLTVADTLDAEEYTIGFRQGSDMVETVNGILSDLADDGSLQELADQYSLTLTNTFQR